ncbi:branched-chain amino acid ABC transporter ATP-binding protein/permease [Enemella sp. A6]|uniref:branched-chain amino acid ABC transporter ATP-binding protein/permease n=1 Tax=Enemella sp. A6 TaxID=3440152 RepID=UPI003EB96287
MIAVWKLIRRVPSFVWPLLAALLLVAVPYIGLDYSTTRQLQLALILSLVVGGLNLSHGYAGELALGQAAMYAAGAYTAGLASKAGVTDLFLQLLIGGAAAMLVGLMTGIPGLRLGGWSLAMTSFFLVLVLPDVIAIFNEETGGREGLSGIAPPTLAGVLLDNTGFYLMIVLVVVLWFAFMRNIVTSRRGVALRVLRQSPVLASSLGISVFGTKLSAYALGAIPAGLAGVLFANLDLYISPEAFGFLLATTVLAASMLGGSTSIYGAVVGAAILQSIASRSTEFQSFALVFTGALLILGGVLLRGGIARLARTMVRRLDRAAGLGVTPVQTGGGLPDTPGRELVVDNVSKAFGGNRALQSVSFTAPPGKVTALIGPNGSGKTTLLNVVCGFYRNDDGTITLDQQRIDRMRSHQVARAGIARTFQTPNIPEGITVTEAVAAGRFIPHRVGLLATALRLPQFLRARRDDLRITHAVLDMVGLLGLRDQEAVSLPLGRRRLLEVARALIAEPGVLLLDECASGLDEHEIERLAELIRRIRDAGGTVLLVEHNFRLVLDLADDIVVLAQGKVIAQGPPEQIEHDPEVARQYLGLDPAEQGAAE